MDTKPAPDQSQAGSTVVTPASADPLAGDAPPLKTSLREIIAKTYADKPVVEPAKPAAAAPAVEPAAVPVKPQSLLSRRAPAAAPPAAAPVTDELPAELPADTPEPTKVNWKKAREVERKLKADLTAKQAEIEALRVQTKSLPADTAELQQLKTERQAMLDRLAVVDLQSHPDFVNQYVKPQQSALAAAKEVLDYSGKEGVDLSGLLGKSVKDFNAEVSKLTEGLNSMDATTVQTSLRTAYTASRGASEALKSSSQLGQALVAKQAQEAKQAFETVFNKVNEFLVTVEPEANASEEDRASAIAHNKAVTDFRAAAEHNAFGKISHTGAAELSVKAALADLLMNHGLPRAEAEYTRVSAQLKAAQAELSALKGSRKVGSVVGDPSAAVAGGVKGNGKQSLHDLVQNVYSRRT